MNDVKFLIGHEKFAKEYSAHQKDVNRNATYQSQTGCADEPSANTYKKQRLDGIRETIDDQKQVGTKPTKNSNLESVSVVQDFDSIFQSELL